MKRRTSLPCFFVAASLFSASCAPADAPTQSPEAELRAENYRAPHVWCKNEDDSHADGVIASVDVDPNGGTPFLRITQWQLLSGMDKTFEVTFGGQIVSVLKSDRFTIEDDEAGKLVVANTVDGNLEGTFTLAGKTTKLSCQPHKLYCATPQGTQTDNPFRRIVVARHGKVVDLQDRWTGVAVDEITVRISPKGMSGFFADGTASLDEDPNGVLEGNGAHVADPLNGTLDVVWDQASKKRVATFAPGDGFKSHFEVPAAGFPTADCDIAEPVPAASP